MEGQLASPTEVEEGEVVVPEALLARLAAIEEECFIVKKETMQEENKSKGHNLLVHETSVHVGNYDTCCRSNGIDSKVIVSIVGSTMMQRSTQGSI